jgi:hypothetical protein
MIRPDTFVRFVLTVLGLGVGMTAGFFIGPAFESGDGFEELGAAVYGALAGAPVGAVAGNFLGTTVSRRRRSSPQAPGWGRAFLEGLGLVFGIGGGWALAAMTDAGQSVSGLMNIVAIAFGVLGFAAGAAVANRVVADRNGGAGGNGER